MTHSERKGAQESLLGCWRCAVFDLEVVTWVCTYRNAWSCPLRFVEFTACKLQLKERLITEEIRNASRPGRAVPETERKVRGEWEVSCHKERARHTREVGLRCRHGEDRGTEGGKERSKGEERVTTTIAGHGQGNMAA